MAVLTLEGVVESGQIRLLGGESLPEKTTVYVVVPFVPKEAEEDHDKQPQTEQTEFVVTLSPNPRIFSPRFVDRQQAVRFAESMVMQSKEEESATVSQ